MPRWGMVVDLLKCVGCQTCTLACKQANNTPRGILWRWVADCELGSYPNVSRVFLPMGCQHCANPPCLEVCPTTATYQRPDGIVDIHYERCIGCGYCVVACPYLARSITLEAKPYYDTGLTSPEALGAWRDRLGVCTKCNFCLPRIEQGLAAGLRPGIDPDASPVCVSSCIANALHFGDLDDPESIVARYIRENATARLSEELGTDPRVYYVVERGAADSEQLPGPANGSRPARLMQPRRQQVWKWPAVANFVLGGMGAAAYLISMLVWPAGPLTLVAPALVAAGLLAVAIEAGRPARAFNLFRHLRRSWMSREALAATVFLLAAVWDWFMPHLAMRGLAGAAALAFMLCQGFIVYRARAVIVWNSRIMPVLFLTSDFSGGSGLTLVLAAAVGRQGLVGAQLLRFAVGAAVLNSAVWMAYLASRDRISRKAVAALCRPAALALVEDAGHALPVLLLILALAAGWSAPTQSLTAAFAGALLVFGSAAQKIGVVRVAGFLRPITLALLGRPRAHHSMEAL